MANCCSYNEFCKRLITIAEVEKFGKSAMTKTNCTNYSGAVSSVTYESCCGEDNHISSYTPTFEELSGYTYERFINPSDEIEFYFQNWSANNDVYWYYDRDGFVLKDNGWSPNCCVGYSNVRIEDLDFEYTEFSGFTVTGTVSGSCDPSNNVNFAYVMQRKKIDGCEFLSGITNNNQTLINNSISVESAMTLTRNKPEAWSQIFSAISVTNDSSQTNYIPFESFVSATTDGVTIFKADIFSPRFSDAEGSSNSNNDCEDLELHVNKADVYVKIIPKFRGCIKGDSGYEVHRESASTAFNWDTGNRCSYHDIPYTGESVVVGTYSGKIPYQIQAQVCYNNDDNNCQDIDLFDAQNGVCTYEYDSNNNLIFNVQENNNSNPRKIKITITIELCSKYAMSTCSICQLGKDAGAPRGTCCTGFVNLFSSINCDDYNNNIDNKYKEIKTSN